MARGHRRGALARRPLTNPAAVPQLFRLDKRRSYLVAPSRGGAVRCPLVSGSHEQNRHFTANESHEYNQVPN